LIIYQKGRSFCGGLEILCASSPAGTPRRRSLVFLHGAFAGAWVWAEGFLPWFARRGYPAYALSFRGHGESDAAGDLHDLGVNDYRDDVRALLDRFGEAPVLIGHSMGGYVVQKIVEEVDLPAYVLMASVPPSGLIPASPGLRSASTTSRRPSCVNIAMPRSSLGAPSTSHSRSAATQLPA